MIATHQLERTVELLYSRCCRILQDRELAWDAVQEVFARYYEKHQTQTIQNPLHYLYRSSTNHCLNLLRQHKRTLPMLPEVLEQHLGASLPQAEGRIVVNKLVQRFGQEDVKLMVYRYVDRMTHQEIADVCGMSRRGVIHKLNRIESRMQKYLNR